MFHFSMDLSPRPGRADRASRDLLYPASQPRFNQLGLKIFRKVQTFPKAKLGFALLATVYIAFTLRTAVHEALTLH